MDPAIPTPPQEWPAADPDDGREPVEEMAEEYLGRLRRGERPDDVPADTSVVVDALPRERDAARETFPRERFQPPTGVSAGTFS